MEGDSLHGVVSAMAGIDEAIDRLALKVGQMDDRLEAVLRAESDPMPSDNLATVRTRSPLAYEIDNKTARLHEIADRLSVLLSRVDL